MLSAYIPGRSAIVGLGCVVVTLAMTTQEEDLVLDIIVRVPIQLLDLMIKAFPLRKSLVVIVVLLFMISRIGTVDKPKIYGSLNAPNERDALVSHPPQDARVLFER